MNEQKKLSPGQLIDILKYYIIVTKTARSSIDIAFSKKIIIDTKHHPRYLVSISIPFVGKTIRLFPLYTTTYFVNFSGIMMLNTFISPKEIQEQYKESLQEPLNYKQYDIIMRNSLVNRAIAKLVDRDQYNEFMKILDIDKEQAWNISESIKYSLDTVRQHRRVKIKDYESFDDIIDILKIIITHLE